MSDRRRFLFSTGLLAAGAAACSAWPAKSSGSSSPSASPAVQRTDAPGLSGLSPQGSQQTVPTQAPQRAETTGRGPNFVLIVADDIGFGEIGCYGQKKIKTPRIDQLAAEGLRFTDAYAAAPVCAPSRASLLTGLHTGHGSVRRNPPKDGDIPLGLGDRTMGEMLQAAGYRTGLFGKWGFGPDSANTTAHPNSRGFSDFFGYLTHHSAKSYYPPYLWDNRKKVTLPGNTGDAGPLYGPDLIMKKAVDFLRAAKNDPFLLLLTLPLPHAPSVVAGLGQYQKKDWRRQDKVHAAQITRLDSYVGIIIDELRKNGLDGDTIVIFTSDNGPHEEDGVHPRFFDAAGPFRGIKRNLYEGGIRVPFIVWSPKLLQRTVKKRSTHPTSSYDLLATFADFAGARPPVNDGLSLKKVWTGTGGAPVHEYLYWLRLHAGSTWTNRKEDHGKGKRAAAAVRFGPWKLVGFAPGQGYSTPGGKWTYELYNLNSDPGERKNLAAHKPALVKRGERYLKESWRQPN